MAGLSFIPVEDGQVITAANWNELISAIQNGSIFTTTSFVADLITTLDTRVATLEGKVTALEATERRQRMREQFTLTTGQSLVNLAKTPLLDSEELAMNGLSLARSGLPVGDTNDYAITLSQITFESAFALQIVEGDRLVVIYDFEVT